MTLTIRATGLLYEFLPGATAPGQSLSIECPAGSTVAALLGQLGVPADEPMLVSLNGQVLPEPGEQPLADGDVLVLMEPLTAG